MMETKIIAAVRRPGPGWRSWYMTRRGCRRMASTAAMALGIGSRSSGLSPSGTARDQEGGMGECGICGGIAAPVGLMSIGLVFSVQYSVFSRAWCVVLGAWWV